MKQNAKWRENANSCYLVFENAPYLTSQTANHQTFHKVLSSFTENDAALGNLGFPVIQWDFLLFNMLTCHLDSVIVDQFDLNMPQLKFQPSNLYRICKNEL